jgi:hypothetical protein
MMGPPGNPERFRKVRQDLDGLDAAARRGRLTDRLHRLMVELEGDLVALLSLGLSQNAPKAGATGAAGLRERVHSVTVGCGGRIWPLPNPRLRRSRAMMASIKSPLYKHEAVSHELGEVIDQVSHAADVGCDGLDSGNELLISPAQGHDPAQCLWRARQQTSGPAAGRYAPGWQGDLGRLHLDNPSPFGPTAHDIVAALEAGSVRNSPRSAASGCDNWPDTRMHPSRPVSADFPLTLEGPSTTSPHHQRNIFLEDGLRPLT